MKIKNIITFFLVAFILASCTPAATLAPTEIPTPSPTSTLVTQKPTATLIPIQDTATLTESVASSSLCGESVLVSPTLRKLTSETYLVTLSYPANWECDNSNLSPFGYSGTDGFFRIQSQSMKVGPAKPVCENEVQHSIDKNGKDPNRYGASPITEILRVDNQPACLVLPSDDQPPAEFGLSLLVVEYPKLDEGRARLLLLFADKNHIHDFISTLKFIRS